MVGPRIRFGGVDEKYVFSSTFGLSANKSGQYRGKKCCKNPTQEKVPFLSIRGVVHRIRNGVKIHGKA